MTREKRATVTDAARKDWLSADEAFDEHAVRVVH
jgi:hypothetical protein